MLRPPRLSLQRLPRLCRLPPLPPLVLAFSSSFSPLRRLHSQGAPSPVETACSVLAATPARPLQTTAWRNGGGGGGVVKPFVLADIGEGITECEIVKWLVKPGDKVEEFDPLVEVMSDKASVEITSPFSGKIATLGGDVGDMLKVGSTLCGIVTEGEEGGEGPVGEATPPSPPPTPAQADPVAPTPSSRIGPPTPSPSSSSPSDVLATPGTRRFAREHNVDVNQVRGTGKDGRVTKEDVLAFSKSPSSAPVPPSAPSSAPAPPASPSSTSTIPLSPTRRAMFRSMTSSLLIPHFAYSDTLDVTELERFR
ncbi:hypothetical protein JCM8547_003755, partial [Rhodosporidiobolus lusitaniae]